MQIVNLNLKMVFIIAKPLLLIIDCNSQKAPPLNPLPDGEGKNVNQGLTPSGEARKVSVPPEKKDIIGFYKSLPLEGGVTK